VLWIISAVLATAGGAGDSCEVKADCAAGLQCVSGACAQSCQRAADCSGGMRCRKNVCIAPEVQTPPPPPQQQYQAPPQYQPPVYQAQPYQQPFLPGAGPPIDLRVEGASGSAMSLRFGSRHGPVLKQCSLPCSLNVPSGPYVVQLDGDGVRPWSGSLGLNQSSTLYTTPGSSTLYGLGVAGVVLGSAAIATGATVLGLYYTWSGTVEGTAAALMAAGVGVTVLSSFLIVASRSDVSLTGATDRVRPVLRVGGVVVGATGVAIALASIPAFVDMSARLQSLRVYGADVFDVNRLSADRAIGIALAATGGLLAAGGVALAITHWGDGERAGQTQLSIAPTLGGLQASRRF
jgi:hypothetical protein